VTMHRQPGFGRVVGQRANALATACGEDRGGGRGVHARAV
jgi:hypothetical protein